MKHSLALIALLCTGFFMGTAAMAQIEPDNFPEAYVARKGIQRAVMYTSRIPITKGDSGKKSFTLAKELGHTEWVYNRQGMLLSESGYDGQNLSRKKTYSYDAKGRISEIADTSWYEGGPPHTKTISPAYNFRDQKTLEYCNYPNNPSHKIEYEYDFNDLSRETYYNWLFEYIPRTRKDYRTKDSLKITTHYRRNSKEQSWKTEYISIETYNKEGKLLREKVMEPKGKMLAETYYSYGPEGRMSQRKGYDLRRDGYWLDAEGNTIWNTTRFAYDEEGVLKSRSFYHNEVLTDRIFYEYKYRHYR